MDFLYSDYLYLLISIPIFILLFAISKFYKKEQNRELLGENLLRKLTVPGIKGLQTMQFIFFVLALGASIIALARPLGGMKNIDRDTVGADVVICFDISQSMLVRDIKPNRLEAGKEALRDLVYRLNGDRMGIVIFAEEPMIFCPLTADYGALISFIDSIDYEQMDSGTNMKKALEFSKKIIDRNKDIPSTGKAIILISDGEDQDSNPETAAKELKKDGLTVISIGVGTTTGGPIPVPKKSIFDSMMVNPFFNKLEAFDKQEVEYKKYKGKMVISKLETEHLNKIAKTTGGEYYHIEDLKNGKVLKNEINKLKKFKGKSKKFEDREDIFQVFLLPAVALLLLSLFIPEEWTRKKYYQ